MILTRDEILEYVRFEPMLDEFQIQACAVDLRLGEEVYLEDEHVLAKTLEKVTLPKNVVGIVYPRSSLNRRRITLDMTGIVDPGYEGHLTLPLTNWGKPVILNRGERIASIVFHYLSKEVEPRQSKYHNSDGTFVPDKSEEMSLIDAGDLQTLKLKFGVQPLV